jgi:1-acyl-sn-glycerol-3-phosphate acyltransferase
MHLFNASSVFNDSAIKEILSIVNDTEKLKSRLIEVKKLLLKAYNFKAYNLPEDFTSNSYIIATNHLTDSDAPLIMSYYYELMHKVKDTYPQLFVFAKENCFNGVSIPVELMPILELEKVIAVDRKSIGGSKAAMRAARMWFTEGDKPKHFLIFSQGTIFDINKDEAEDIEPGAFWLGRLLGIPVLPAFIEQAVEGAENRLVFAEPIYIPKDCRNFDEHKKLWLERVIEAQNELDTLTGIPARETVLDKEHQTRKRFVPTDEHGDGVGGSTEGI